MDEADRMATQIAIIDYGKLLMLDTPENLKKTVGEGDLLEIISEKASADELQKLVSILNEKKFAVTAQIQGILIKHANIIGHLTEIKAVCDQMNFRVSEFKLRENTLEDVFIHLTGRNLRA
jgi:ABC-2 type transport system ATP-binding protein